MHIQIWQLLPHAGEALHVRTCALGYGGKGWLEPPCSIGQSQLVTA